MSVNKVILLGRLGKDPELKHTQSGKSVASFSVATSERYTKDGEKQESTEWHNCQAWGKAGEIITQYAKKGSEIYIEGKIRTNEWEDKDGIKRSMKNVIVDTFSFIGKRDRSDDTSGFGESRSARDSNPVIDDTLPF